MNDSALAIVCTVAAVTVFCRALPFLFFRGSRPVPQAVTYLGLALPYAVISLLVVYCLRGIDLSASPFGAPELIASALTVLVHLWKRNNLLSIGVATVAYMLMVQFLFH